MGIIEKMPVNRFWIIAMLGYLLVGCGLKAIPYSLPFKTAAAPFNFNLSFSFIDGDTAVGLNHDPSQHGKTVSSTAMNGTVYAAWREGYGSGQDNIRVAKYLGGSGWSAADGGAATGINVSTSTFTNSPTLTNDGTHLFATWHEGGSNHHIYVKTSDGLGSWSAISDTSAGLNYSPSGDATLPTIALAGGTLNVLWCENSRVRVSRYSGSGTGWSLINGGGVNGLSYGGAVSSLNASIGTDGTNLFATWVENNSSSVQQLRVAQYVGPGWTFIDGNSLNGLNMNPSVNASNPQISFYNGHLILTWFEAGIIRAKKYVGSSWISIDGGGLNRSLSQPAYTNGFGQSAVQNGRFYFSWYEKAPNGFFQVRIAEYDDATWNFADGGSTQAGLNFNSADTIGYQSSLVAFAGGIMVLWSEQTSGSTNEIRAALGQ